MITSPSAGDPAWPAPAGASASTAATSAPCLRSNGVSTNGAAADSEEMDFGRLGKKVRPGIFWKKKVG